MTWTHRHAEQLYNVREWGRGYFRVNERGHVECTPDRTADAEGVVGPAIDVYELVGSLKKRGVELPVLLRFNGVLRSRVRELRGAFDRAREEFGYDAAYRCVYPIKVNQQRQVVQVLLEDEGAHRGVDLEVGSKPELLAAISLLSGKRSLVVCNGYKDREYVETAMLSSKVGLEPLLVIEKASELDTILAATEHLNIRPRVGVRLRLSGRGSGRWSESGGDRSKFGLSVRRIVEVVEKLKAKGMLDCLQLLHFHVGSQITNIRALKAALREATRTLVGLHELGARIRFFDVGGGLGVDYDGSRTNFESSKNYSLQEYANDVVYHVLEVCREFELPQPEILSESGRALTAHHAVLVTETLGVSHLVPRDEPAPLEDDAPDILRNLAELSRNVTSKNYQESYHDALAMREECLTLFNVGQVSLGDRARADEFFWRTCSRIHSVTRELDYVPDDLERLEQDLADTYYLNFSLFQSMPDSWAVDQLFPVLPLHRNEEEPERWATLADITCDSDGKVDRFIDLRDVRRTLALHEPRSGEPYLLGFFLVGAYQEILGDMHNLFGDTNAVHVDVTEDGRVRLSDLVRGDRVKDVLSYVQYADGELVRDLRRSIETAIDEDRITYEESAALIKRYESGLRSYTYLAQPGTENE